MARSASRSTARRRSESVAMPCASSTMTTSQRHAATAGSTSIRFAKSSDAIAVGTVVHGLTPCGNAAWRRLSSSASRTVASRLKRDASSVCHWSRKPAGVNTSTRSAAPRARSSATTRPASIVFPSPTSSASSTREPRPRTMASAGASWWGKTSSAAASAVRRPPGGVSAARRARQAARHRVRRTRFGRGRGWMGSTASNGDSRDWRSPAFDASAPARTTRLQAP